MVQVGKGCRLINEPHAELFWNNQLKAQVLIQPMVLNKRSRKQGGTSLPSGDKGHRGDLTWEDIYSLLQFIFSLVYLVANLAFLVGHNVCMEQA